VTIFEKLKMFVAGKKFIYEIKEAYMVAETPVTPGWKTSEFWLSGLTAAGTLIGTLAGIIPEKIGITAAALITAAYTIARAWTKKPTVVVAGPPQQPPVA
jgi:hypothetical protein